MRACLEVTAILSNHGVLRSAGRHRIINMPNEKNNISLKGASSIAYHLGAEPIVQIRSRRRENEHLAQTIA
ncbi:hypothetical protein B0J17DRAFT_115540 [Rhizoctonia solani]|nr:hypothetical protein B0J17DRAFT_115540 [Rhizoctonia solani]